MARKSKAAIQEAIWQEAIAIVDKERTNWEEAVTYVTEKIGFRMRELIRIMRKNYWGVFDQPIDKNTGREKVWFGLAMSTVETWLKNIDIDQKDINFVARNPNGYDTTEFTRLVVKDYLDRQYFGETLDTDERQVLIDGTLVWKTWEDRSSGKVVMKRKTVDLLNIYIDPTEDNIQSAYRFTERSLMLPDQIRGMTGWDNTDDLDGSQTLNKIDGNRRSNFGTQTTGMYRDVWEMWGKIPKYLITGNMKSSDAHEEIDGHVIISGLEAPNPTCHLIEENKRKDKFGMVLKPYEEWRVAKISGRWYGLGPVERILALQEYLNTLINIRINRGYISQLGLFKIKKGKGITAQMLNRLPVNGALQVTDMDDIEQMEVTEAGQSSYNDEDVIKYWAQQISSAFPVSAGDSLPASTSATASAISSQAAKSSYTMFKENTGLFIERWLDRHALRIIAKTINEGDIIRLSDEDDKFQDLVERIALNNVAAELEKAEILPSEQEMMMVLQMEEERLRKSGHVFIESVQDIVADELDARVHVTNEDLDTSVTVQSLMSLMQIPPENRDDDAVKQIYDLLGLERPKKQVQPVQQAQVGQAPQTPQGQQAQQPIQPQPNQQQIMQQANQPMLP